MESYEYQIRTRETPNTDTFHTVCGTQAGNLCLNNDTNLLIFRINENTPDDKDKVIRFFYNPSRAFKENSSP